MRILILGAFEQELEGIVRLFPELKETMISKRRCLVCSNNDYDIAISLTGIGSTAAACTATALCEGYSPDLILMCGVAGGLVAGQQIGDLVLGDKIIDSDLYPLRSILSGSPYEQCLTDPHTLNPFLCEYAVHPLLINIGSNLPIERLNTGTIITSNEFPVPKNLFSDNKLAGSVIEMEGAGLLKATGYYGTHTLIIRAISNLIDATGADLGTTSCNLKICSERLAIFLKYFLEHISELREMATQHNQRRVDEMIAYSTSEGGW